MASSAVAVGGDGVSSSVVERLLSVSVLDPQKQGDGLSAHTSYKVMAQYSRASGGEPSSFTVIRRFSDFVWLRGELREHHPDLLIPALPEKQALGRLNAEFVDIRHRALQRFMARICAHPLLSAADVVKQFVSLGADAFSALTAAKKSATAMMTGAAAAAGGGVVRLIKTAAGAIRSVARGRGESSAGAAPKGKSTEDISFEEIEAYMLNQAPIVTALYNQAAAQAVRHREQAQLLLEYGGAIRALGSSEGGALGNALAQSGIALWADSTSSYELSVEESELYVERLADIVRGIRAGKEMLDERTRASSNLADSLAVVESLRARLTALTTSPAQAADKSRVENELVAAQSAVTSSRAQYDATAANVIAEVERYRSSLRADFTSILLDLTNIYARMADKHATAWAALGPITAAAITAEGATPLASVAIAPAAPAPAIGGSGGAAGAGAYAGVSEMPYASVF